MKTKDLISLSPELYLLGATIYYWILTSNLLNPIAIILLCALTYQMTAQKLTTGLIIASLFIVLNAYLVLALISELSEFSEPNKDWANVLIFGTLFLGFNLLMGTFMFWKYIKRKTD